MEEAPVLGGKHRALHDLPDLVERHPARARAVVRPDLAQQVAVPVLYPDRPGRPPHPQLRGHRRQRRPEHQQHHRKPEQREADPRATAPRHGLFATAPLATGPTGPVPTTKRVAADAPQTSGEYMHSARVGGTTKSPGVVARAR